MSTVNKSNKTHLRCNSHFGLTDVGMSSTVISAIGVVPHYFKRRKDAAFTGIGLGTGIAFTAYPYITESAFTTFGYKYGILSLLPIFTCSIAAAVIFIPQLPAEKPESLLKLLKSYLQTMKHFITPFFLLNAVFMNGSRDGLAVNYFSYLSHNFGQQAAVIAFTIHGVSFLISTIVFTLYGLRYSGNYLVFHLVTSFAFGLLICIIPIIQSVTVIYVFSAGLGICFGLTSGFKGNVVTHLFPLKDTAYLYGLTEAVGGIGAFAIPYAAGHIDKNLSYGNGLYFIGSCVIFGSIVLCTPAVIRPHLWTRYEKRKKNGDSGQAQDPAQPRTADSASQGQDPEKF